MKVQSVVLCVRGDTEVFLTCPTLSFFPSACSLVKTPLGGTSDVPPVQADLQ